MSESDMDWNKRSKSSKVAFLVLLLIGIGVLLLYWWWGAGWGRANELFVFGGFGLVIISCPIGIYSAAQAKKRKPKNEKPHRPVSNQAASPVVDVGTMKTRLFGMIKSMQKVDLTQAPAMLGMSRQALQQLLFELVGEGKVTGEFADDDTFIIVSGVDSFITELDSAFSSWEKKEETKEGKLDFSMQ